MGGGAQKDDDEMITAINVTPLVDVVLVLLIILMVTASYIVSKAIPMELPQAETGEPNANPRTITVSIDAAGTLAVDAEPITDSQFRGRIRQYLTTLANPATEARATIQAAGAVPHRRFVWVLDVLRSERVPRYALNVSPSDRAEPDPEAETP